MISSGKIVPIYRSLNIASTHMYSKKAKTGPLYSLLRSADPT